MIKNTEEDLGLQGFSARHPIGRFFLHQATEHEFGEAIFKSLGKTIRFPIIIVIAAVALGSALSTEFNKVVRLPSSSMCLSQPPPRHMCSHGNKHCIE